MTSKRPACDAPVRATYRLQFHKGFAFAMAARLAEYLGRLGVSHVYASPIQKARAGSLHGYDVIDHSMINPEPGGEAGFRAMAAELRRHGVGVVLDIVPNHMAVGGDDNVLWLDVLKHGRRSRYASWFDIDFGRADPALAGRVHAPFLGESLCDAISAGKFTLVADPERGGAALRYGEHLFPLRPEDDGLAAAHGQAPLPPHEMAQLVARQNFAPDCWRNAGDRVNWRRFFDMNTLGAIRIDNPEVFEAVHRLPFQLYQEGIIDGLRIDHVDGLADPAAYCRQLRSRLTQLQAARPAWATSGPAWIVVEKILAPGETLPASWGVDGTSGYDFMDAAGAVIHRAQAAAPLDALWRNVSGRTAAFHDEEREARALVLEHAFGGQLETLVNIFVALAASAGDAARRLPRGAMRRGLARLLIRLHAYRPYLTGDAAPEDPGPFLGAAHEAALAEPLAEHEALHFIMAALAGKRDALHGPLRKEATARFSQLSAPLAARSVEDTAFYRYGRLLSRNEVGADPSRLALGASEFHAMMMQRAADMPQAMLALATHDHKRGPDVRARLAMLSHDVDGWAQRLARWRALNASVRPSALDAGDELQIYQMLLGLWPWRDDASRRDELAERLCRWAVKALREAKLRSDWRTPDETCERAVTSFIRALLDPARSGAFQDSLQEYLDYVGPAAALAGLNMLALQCTAPGVPDTYQGAEFWDLSAVDPDNRRPVDFSARQDALASDVSDHDLARSWRDGRIKQRLLQRLLQCRRDHPALFTAGDWRPLAMAGDQNQAIAAIRRHGGLVLAVIAPLAGPGCVQEDLSLAQGWWDKAQIALPTVRGRWRTVFSLAPPCATAPWGASISVLLGEAPTARQDVA